MGSSLISLLLAWNWTSLVPWELSFYPGLSADQSIWSPVPYLLGHHTPVSPKYVHLNIQISDFILAEMLFCQWHVEFFLCTVLHVHRNASTQMSNRWANMCHVFAGRGNEYFLNGQFLLWDTLAGNQGSCVHQNNIQSKILNTTTMISCRHFS